MAIINYFADLSNTRITVGSVAGDTTIEVNDASIFTTSQSIIVEANSYDIDSISGQVITLSTALSTDAPTDSVITIDRSNSTVYDGLTPDTAVSTIFIPTDASSDSNIVWVRRNNGYTLSNNATLTFSEIVFWPSQGGYMYDTRPQAGIDAGWDNDADASFISLGQYTIDTRETTKTNKCSINNLSNFDSPVRTAIPSFYIDGADASFTNSKITHLGTNEETGALFRKVGAVGDANVFFYNCDVSIPDNGIISKINVEDPNGVMRVEVHNSDNIDILFGIRKHTTASYKYLNNTYFTAINSTLIVSQSLIKGDSRRAYFNGHFHINIEKSTINCSSLTGGTTEDRYFGQPLPHIKVNSSDINASSHMVHFRTGGNTGGHAWSSYVPIVFKGSKLRSLGDIVHIYKGIYNTIQLFSPISIIGCEVDTLSNIVYTSGLSRVDSICIAGNKILKATNIVSSDASCLRTSPIHVSNALIDGDIINRGDGFIVEANNCVVRGQLVNASAGVDSFSGENLSALGFKGAGSATLRNCSLESLSPDDLLSGRGTKILKGCIINSKGADIGTNEMSDITYLGCEINGNIDNSSMSKATVFDSTIMNMSVPYFSKSNISRKALNSIFRIGGADGSLEIKPLSQADEYVVAYTKDIIGTLIGGTSKATVFFTSAFGYPAIKDKCRFTLNFSDSLGNKQVVDGEIIEDNTSQWDGITLGMNGFKVEFSPAETGRAVGDNSDAMVEISYYPASEELYSLYVDLNIVSV